MVGPRRGYHKFEIFWVLKQPDEECYLPIEPVAFSQTEIEASVGSDRSTSEIQA